jgi:hypothetical protein
VFDRGLFFNSSYEACTFEVQNNRDNANTTGKQIYVRG